MKTATVPQWTLSDRLAKARHFAGLEQAELAARMGLSLKTVSRYERGESPRFDTLISWAEVCNVDANWLLTGVEVRADNDATTHRYPQPTLFAVVA